MVKEIWRFFIQEGPMAFVTLSIVLRLLMQYNGEQVNLKMTQKGVRRRWEPGVGSNPTSVKFVLFFIGNNQVGHLQSAIHK